MKSLLALCLAAAFASVSQAQTASIDALRISDAVIDSTWAATEAAYGPLFDGIASQARSKGASEKSAQVFAQELRQAFSKDAMVQIYAEVLTDQMTTEELTATRAFIQSKAGRQFLQMSNAMLENTRFIRPIMANACTRVRKQLGSDTSDVAVQICSAF